MGFRNPGDNRLSNVCLCLSFVLVFRRTISPSVRDNWSVRLSTARNLRVKSSLLHSLSSFHFLTILWHFFFLLSFQWNNAADGSQRQMEEGRRECSHLSKQRRSLTKHNFKCTVASGFVWPGVQITQSFYSADAKKTTSIFVFQQFHCFLKNIKISL